MKANDSLVAQAQALVGNPSWHQQVAMMRESIIIKGKKARNEEKKIEVWAELEGFDKLVMFLNNIANYRKNVGYGDQ